MDFAYVLGPYQIIKVIGKGTYGTAFLCKRKQDDTLSVLKEVTLSTLNDERFKETQNEIKVLSTLDHPYIIKYYDSFYENKSVYISMEYATHGNLAEYMFQRQHYLLPQNEISYFLCQMLLGVQHIHKMKIIHRDLKAENILLSGPYGNTVKIGDFGIARILGKGKAMTVIGTPYYLAPEVCENKPYDTKADVWALGCLLYEMCTHKRAFDATSLLGLVHQITSGSVIPINKSYYDYQIQELIDSMLTVVPEKRCSISRALKKPVLATMLYSLDSYCQTHCVYNV